MSTLPWSISLGLIKHIIWLINNSYIINKVTLIRILKYIYKFNTLKRRAYITGLTGSAGNAIVLKDSALVTTDSSQSLKFKNISLLKLKTWKIVFKWYVFNFHRYCIQAVKQVYCEWDIKCPGSTTDIKNFVSDRKEKIQKIGANPFLFTKSTWESYETSFKTDGIELVKDRLDQKKIKKKFWTFKMINFR